MIVSYPSLMVISLDRTTNLLTDSFQPIASGLTVAQAATAINRMDLPLYVEAHFTTYHDVPVSVDKQIATKVRRLKKLAALCGRVVTHVEPARVGSVNYVALLAR